MKTIWNGHIIRPSVELCAFRVFYQQIAFYSDCVLIKSKNVLQFVGMIRAIDLHAPIKTSNDMEMQRYTEHESHNNSTDVINIMVKIGNEFASLAAKAALSSNAIAKKKTEKTKKREINVETDQLNLRLFVFNQLRSGPVYCPYGIASSCTMCQRSLINKIKLKRKLDFSSHRLFRARNYSSLSALFRSNVAI